MSEFKYTGDIGAVNRIAGMPASQFIEACIVLACMIFAACMFAWYAKECQKIDREFEPIDRALAEIKAKNDEWFNRNRG